MVKLTEFVEAVNKLGGFSKVNHFAVEIATPPVLADVSTARYLSLLCQATSLPGVAIGTDDRYLPQGYGVPQRMPWGVLFTDISLSFYADNKGVINSIMTRWMDSIVQFNNKDDKVNQDGQAYFVNYRNDYATDITIRTYNEVKETVIEYTLHDAYPAALYDSVVNWQSQDEIQRVSVRFLFTRWSVKYYKVTTDVAKDISNIKSNLTDYLRSDRSPQFLQNITDSIQNSAARTVNNLGDRFIENVQQAIPLISGSIGDLRI